MWSPIPYRILGGINQDDSEDSIGESEVVDASNFLFERGESFNRPGVNPVPLTGGFTGTIGFGKSFRAPSGAGPFTLLISADATLWRLNADLSVTQLTPTGATATFVDGNFHNACVVNGVILVGNTAGANDFRWDPAGTTYSANIGPYRYLTGYLSRAIGANGPGAPRDVAWTISGDETNWSGVGSGKTPLTDCPDDITGLGTLRNVIVILRRSGIHLGFPTGVSLPTFRFETYIREGPGCFYPSTAAWDNNTAYFVAADDVYMYDLTQVTPIGRKIRDELISYLDAGVIYRGFISVGTKSLTERRMRYRYNLAPHSSTVQAPMFPHFVYDRLEGKWSKHFYSSAASSIRGGFYYIPSASLEATAIYDASNPPNLMQWDASLACETPAFLLGKVMPVPPVESDYRCNRVLLRHRNNGVSDEVKVSVSATLPDVEKSNSDTKTIGTIEATRRWMRNLFNIDVTGQDFQLRIDVPPGVRFSTNYAALQTTESGIFRGPNP